MTKEKELKEKILTLIKEYYTLVHKPSQEKLFIEGQSKISYAKRVFDAEEMLNLVDSSLDFWLTYGKYSKEFERELANYLGVKYSLLVNSGSSANLLSFFALTSPLLKERQIQRGDEVITVAAAFPTTVSPIVQYGAIPVFVDIESKHLNIDVSKLEDAVSEKTKAVMIAHTLGNPFDIEAVKAFCQKHQLWLIEDNCDALGSLYKGRRTGSWGDIATSSFYPPHHITMGEGGAVYTNNPLLKKILLSMRDWGRECWCESGVDNSCNARFQQQRGKLPLGYDHKYIYSHFGFNLKVSDMQAAIGVGQLKKLPFFTKRRLENFTLLSQGLKDIPSLQLVEAQKDAEPSWFGFFINIQESAPYSRNDIVQFLEKKGIQTRNLFSGNLVRQPMFQSLIEGKDYRISGKLSVTDYVMNNGFWIGVYPGMSREMINYMIKKIRGFIDAQ